MASATAGADVTSSRSVPERARASATSRPAVMSGAVFALVTSTALLVSFSESMLIPALPTIQAEYNASAAAVSWVPAIYLLVGAISVPLFGKLGDLYGKKRMLIVVMSAYSAAVVLDGFAWSLESLLAFRAVQGLGLAMFPLVLSMIHDQMAESRVPVAVGTVSAMNGVGAAIGLVGGAYITQTFGWQANYHILAPFAVALTLLLWWLAQESPVHASERIDVRGIAVLGLAVTFLLVAISEGGVLGWTSPGSIALFVLAAASFAALVLIERRVKDPLLEIGAPTFPSALKVNLAMLLAGAAMFIGFYMVIYYAQEPSVGLGRDVSSAALILAPAALLMLFFAPLGGRLAQRWSPKRVELIGGALVTVAFLLFVPFHSTGPQMGLVSIVLLAGVSFLLTALSISVLALASKEKVGTEVGLNTSFRTIGQAVGVAISGAFLASFLVPGTVLPSDEAYALTAAAGAVMGALTVVIVLSLPPISAQGVSGAAVG